MIDHGSVGSLPAALRARARLYLAALTLTAASSAGCTGSDASPSAEPDAASAELAQGLPCDVAQVIADKCGTCHGDTPAFGAPMSLTHWDDFQADAPGGGSLTERIIARINDVQRPMPPADHAALLAGEQSLLEAWIADGTPKYEGACDGEADAGTDSAPSLPSVPLDDDADLSECETLTELRAFGAGGPESGEPYEVPMMDDHYECFVFDVPWEDKRHALRLDPLIDEARVLHHWLLYQIPKAEAGSATVCNGIHPDATLVSGWAPGGRAQLLPKDVGMQMPEGKSASFMLEIHYNNTARYPGAVDKSGVRLCTSTKLRKNEAATHTLGNEALLVPPGAYSTSGQCSAPVKATVLSLSPHMHRLGRRMTVDLYRGSQTSTVFDRGFDFYDQRVWQLDEPLELEAGDILRTTCSYMNDTGTYVRYGENTANEMCLNFVLAYPAGALATGSLTGGNNKCME